MTCKTNVTKIGAGNPVRGESKNYQICCTKVYAQTLFLGCSIKSFNASLGWGGEASRLTVELARDNCSYPVLYTDSEGRSQLEIPSIEDDYINKKINNTFTKDENGNSLIPGKVYYIPSSTSNKLVSLYWTDPDPGFYADMPNPQDSIDIIGCAVYFKYDSFEFKGIIKEWTNSGGSGGTKTYTVTIESPAFLLSQTQMILGDYDGGLFVKGVAPNFPNKGFPSSYAGIYTGDIVDQAVPNVINIYGYLEDNTNITTGLPVDNNNIPQYSFGKSGRNDQGIQAISILYGIQDLLNSAEFYNKQKILRYSTFGRIIGVAPKYKIDSSDMPNQDKYKMGLIFPQSFLTSQNRIHYTVDISNVINNATIPKYYRISDNSMNILDFLENITKATGQQLFITLELDFYQGNINPVIKINTFTTLEQPPEGAVQSYIDTITSLGLYVTGYSKGEEYNNTEPVRSMIIGGKQQRLYQVNNSKYAAKQSTLRYNPYLNKFMQIDNFGQQSLQRFRFPDVSNTRYGPFYTDDSPAFSLGRLFLNQDSFDSSESWPKQISRGNYLPSQDFTPVGVGGQAPGGLEFPSSDFDAICPYFGINDITGTIRKVTCHYGKTIAPNGNTGGGVGFLVHFTSDELGLVIGKNFTTTSVRISETEIRAAMSGFDAYVGFICGVINDGGGLDIWDKILSPIFGANSLSSMIRGISEVYNKFNNSQSGTETVPINSKTSILTDPIVFDAITKLHAYFKKIGDENYGKKFMVKIPTPEYWIDAQNFDYTYQIGTTTTGDPIYLSAGSLKTYYSFEPTDFAWEEPYNYIDDTMAVGNAEMDTFIKEDGSIEPILGYNNSPQYDYVREFNKRLNDWLIDSPPNTNLTEFWKFDAYRSAGIRNGDNFSPWVPSLKIDNNSKTLVKAYNWALNDAFGEPIPYEYISKIYTKATVDKEYQSYAMPDGTIVPKIIITTDPIYLQPLGPDAHSVQNAVVEFLAEDYNLNASMRASKIMSLSEKFLNSNQYSTSNFGYSNAQSQSRDNKQYNNLSIHPKAAVPGFAAVPLVINTAIYGPWVSAPDLIKNNIFANNQDARLENLVGGVNLEIMSDLVPWNYGGMRVLDEAALLLAGQENNYQRKSETGQLTVYGVPNFNIGNELKGLAYNFRGPTINNIQTQISESGPSTTYTFRTFTRKFTLFNKENADRLKTIGQNSIKLNKEYRSQGLSIIERIKNIRSTSTIPSYSINGSKLRAYSPMSILVGYSSPYISPKATLTPGFYNRPNWSGDSIRQLTTVTLQDTRELSQEFDHLYSTKSFMSLDGLFHPVSFYPTLNSSTTSYKKYFTSEDGNESGCPMCKGTKSLTIDDTTIRCSYCTSTKAGNEKSIHQSSMGAMPPYLLSNQADNSIVRDPKALENLLNINIKKINYVNLNPIIMPVGELRNKYAQSGDFTSHHIDVVGRSLVPELGSLSITHNLASNLDGLEYKDQNSPDCDIDWNSYTFDQQVGRDPASYQNNYRFLALRGPLVMAGWGFDTEGYPVPNASGEPKELNDAGYPKTITDKNDQNGGFPDDGYEGDIILGKNQVWDDEKGEWSNPKKENNFYKGWGLRPDTWPVGPIDLRWDDAKKVWTAPKPYRMVDVVLEDNLIPPYPARGFIDAVDKKFPLPSGLRRMVFVKDSAQNYGAPRGAKLLCYYDDASGFYEPVSKQNIIATGIIHNDGTNNATIYDNFAKGFNEISNQEETPDPITVQFNNILGFSITKQNQPGFFMFDKTQWVLLSTNAC